MHAPPEESFDAESPASHACVLMRCLRCDAQPAINHTLEVPGICEASVVQSKGEEAGRTLEEAAQDAKMMDEHMSPGMTSNTDPGCRKHNSLNEYDHCGTSKTDRFQESACNLICDMMVVEMQIISLN